MAHEICTTGEWIAKPGEEGALQEAWLAFASWAHSMPGAGTLRLTKDLAQPGRFVSFGIWDSLAQVHAWKGDAEFRERMGRVQHHVARFAPAELEVVEVAGE